MSSLSRLGPIFAKSSLLQHQRHMASAATASDPIQRLFLDKVKEFKGANKGLDEVHTKAMSEEMQRLKRVFNVDENKLTQLEFKFPAEHHVSLHDIDESKELRKQIASGEYQKQLMSEVPKSALMASIPPQEHDEYHYPPNNHPDESLFEEGAPLPPKIAETARPDYEWMADNYTPAKLEEELLVSFGKDMPTIDDDKNMPERDLVNFPTQKQNLDTPPTRYHLIPESWFQFFYPKTGVTGPYAFGFCFSTFLFSKEWLVMEHELLTGFSSAVIFAYAVTRFGPKLREYFIKRIDKSDQDWEAWRLGNLHVLQKMQEIYKGQLNSGDVLESLYQIRQADMNNQVELETRTRLQKIHDETKRRLNYLIAVADSQRQIAHKNMVNWVISNAVSSIGSKQENEVLDNCVVSLRQLAGKHANAI